MGSGIKGKKWGGIRDHRPGIWDHKPWERDQKCCEGIRDQVFRQKIKYHKMTKSTLIGRKELPPFTDGLYKFKCIFAVTFCSGSKLYAIRSAGLA